MGQAIGIIETKGLAAGIEAADAAVKSANVRLIGYELTRGGGQVTIKLEGDVGAVNAAVQAGVQAAGRVGQVMASLVLARPHEDVRPVIFSTATVGLERPQIEKAPVPETAPKPPPEPAAPPEERLFTCNLCRDPECSRQKNEPHPNCIHFEEKH